MEGRTEGVNRRRFVKAAAVASMAAGTGALTWGAANAAAQSAPAPKSALPSAGRPRIGCVSWCFHKFAGGSSPEEALAVIGGLGFEGVDLILLAREDIEGFWTDTTIDRLRRQLDRHKLDVAQFVIFQPVIEGLPSLDAEERKRNLAYFEAGCRIGQKLGAPLVDIVAPWPRELTGPRDYLPRYYDIAEPGPDEKFHIDIAAGFDWDRTWDAFVQTVRTCVECAKAHGLKLTIEHHTHTLIPCADAFLRLWDAIRDPALGYNLDTGWTASQREYPPIAILKTKDRLMNLHVRDIDGLMRQFVHIDNGVMDFAAVAQTLKAIGYAGFLSLEQDKHPGDMQETCRRYVAMMREYLS